MMIFFVDPLPAGWADGCFPPELFSRLSRMVPRLEEISFVS